MNVFNESIYRSHLEHSAKGQSWGKHKYIAIKNGRYIYPEDLKGDKHNEFKKIDAVDKNQKVIEARKKWLGVGANTQASGGSLHATKGSSAGIAREKANLSYSVYKTPHEGAKTRAIAESRKATEQSGKDRDAYIKARQQAAKEANAANQVDRSRQINDQINSAHSNATSSKMDLKPGTKLQKQIEATAKRKEDAAKAAEEAKKKEETKTETATTSTTTEEKKSGSGKGKGGGKKGSGSKKSSNKTDQTNTQTATNASEEAKALGLTDDDIKLLDSNIDVNATDRDTVIKNLALRVLKGDFGNGSERKEKLGKYYAEIQRRVNELMKELKSSKSKETEVTHSEMYAFDLLRNNNGVIGVQALMHMGNKNSGRYRRGSGDRPYQHEGGGRSRARDMSDDDLKKAVARKGLERQYNKMYSSNKLEKTKNVIDATSGAVNRANNKNREKLNRRPQHERMNLDGMSDKELRDKINRELLEKQYSDLFGPEVDTVSKGERKAAEILDYAGDVLAVSSSALAIALAIKGLKG